MNESFGTRFTRLRKEKGLTQEQVAEKLNISSQAVSKWENDASCPDISALSTLAELLEVSCDTLLGRDSQAVVTQNTQNKPIDKMILRVLVDSKDGDKVKINLPMALVKVLVDSNLPLPKINDSDILGNIDFKQLFALVEQGMLGNLLEVQSADGDNVKIFVE